MRPNHVQEDAQQIVKTTNLFFIHYAINARPCYSKHMLAILMACDSCPSGLVAFHTQTAAPSSDPCLKHKRKATIHHAVSTHHPSCLIRHFLKQKLGIRQE
jgi:hypothetical protein